MEGSYPQAAVQPVTVERDGGEAVITFTVPLESAYYVAGARYRKEGTDLRVAIDRCAIRTECATMAKASRPLGDGRRTQVRVPFESGRILLVHADGEQQIHP
jgi:hypothetical protein